jgi:hypothetical protein
LGAFQGSIVCKIPDNFTELRITRAYIKLLCIPENQPDRMVSLGHFGNCEIRMVEASQTGATDVPLFLMELFDHDAQMSVDSCGCHSIKEAAAAFEDFISR